MQRVPDYQSNGNITNYWVNHSLVESDSGEVMDRPIQASRFSCHMTLQPEHVYKFTVDARTTIGFNASLRHKPILISTVREHKGARDWQHGARDRILPRQSSTVQGQNLMPHELLGIIRVLYFFYVQFPTLQVR